MALWGLVRHLWSHLCSKSSYFCSESRLSTSWDSCSTLCCWRSSDLSRLEATAMKFEPRNCHREVVSSDQAGRSSSKLLSSMAFGTFRSPGCLNQSWDCSASISTTVSWPIRMGVSADCSERCSWLALASLELILIQSRDINRSRDLGFKPESDAVRSTSA